MKVFKVWTDNVDYDEYISCVVIARDEEEAILIVREPNVWTGDVSVYFTDTQLENINVEEVVLDKPKLVDSSFNAG